MTTPINTLILGGGGREHALAHALSKSEAIGELHCAPGNPGMADLAAIYKIDVCDTEAILSVCGKHDIGLAVVGPEAPRVSGGSDKLREAGIAVFGPGSDWAKLEGSKAFSKEFMKRH